MSLLKRIEQGQGKPGQPVTEEENPAAAATAATTSGAALTVDDLTGTACGCTRQHFTAGYLP